MHRRTLLNNCLYLLILILLPALVSAAEQGAAPAKPVVLFDQAHSQTFLIEEKGNLHLSSLAGIMAGAGNTVQSSTEPLSDAALAKVTALVISGAFQPLLPTEVAAVTRFIERGGRLALMLHIPQPLAPLLEKLEVDFTNYVLHEQENVIDGDTLNFRAVDLSAPELFAGLSGVSFYGSWALNNTAASSRVVAKTSAKAWLDADGDRQLSKGDAVGSFGVAVMGTLGKGRFLVLGDDALFQNRFIDENNSKFAVNLSQWLVAP
jgi:hypothetical protein